VVGDRGYDAEAIRQGLRARHIVPLLAQRNTEHGSGLGQWRWVVERIPGPGMRSPLLERSAKARRKPPQRHNSLGLLT
jgi:hypothetical protein